MTFSRFIHFLFLLCVTLATACGPKDAGRGASDTRDVKDGLGRIVKVPTSIRRVVSLAPDITETVFAIGAGDRVVGVTTFCTFPEEAKEIARIGDTISPNLEAIVALQPDVVLASTASQIQTFTQILEARGIALYVTSSDSLSGVLENMSALGDLLSLDQSANRVVTSLRSRISALESRAAARPRRRVFVQISREPLFTIGSASFLTSALRTIGADSVTSNVGTAYPKLSKETAATLDPDCLILSDSDDNREPNVVFKSSREVRVIRISADLISRPGPRLVDALELLSREFEAL